MSNLRERALAHVEEQERQRIAQLEQERYRRIEQMREGLRNYLQANLGVDPTGVEIQVFAGPHDGPRVECEVDGIRFRFQFPPGGRHEYWFVALQCCERCGGCANESGHLNDLGALGLFLKQYPPLPAGECPVCTPAHRNTEPSDDPPPGAAVEHCGTVTLAELERVFEEE